MFEKYNCCIYNICFLPGDPEYRRTPFGLTNIPDPTIIPTIILKYYNFNIILNQIWRSEINPTYGDVLLSCSLTKNFEDIERTFIKWRFPKSINDGMLLIFSFRFKNIKTHWKSSVTTFYTFFWWILSSGLTCTLNIKWIY